MKSKNLDKNVKKIYEYCLQNFLKDAQNLLEYNLEQSGNFFIKALRLYLYNGKEIDTKEICEKYQGLQNLEFGDFEKNFNMEFESIKYLQSDVFPYLEKENTIIKIYFDKILEHVNNNNVRLIIDLYTKLVLEQMEKFEPTADITVFLDSYANFLKRIDFKYLGDVVSTDCIPQSNCSKMYFFLADFLQHMLNKAQIQSLCIEVLSNTRDFKEQDGKMYILDKDNYQLSEALDFTSSQVRQIEKHLKFGRMDKQYDNWSMFANQNFDILLDEPLKKGEYSFRDIMRVFTKAKEFLDSDRFLNKIDINCFQLDSYGLNATKIKTIIEDNFLSETWCHYTLEKPFYKFKGNYYCQSMAKRLNDEYILSETIKVHRDKSVKIAYARDIQKERSDKIDFERDLRKFLLDLKDAELIDWTVDRYPQNGLSIKLDGFIEIDAIFVWEKNLYIIEAKNIDKKFSVESRINKTRYLYSGTFQIINTLNQICVNKDDFIKLLLQKDIAVPEFNEVVGILLCNHLVYSQFKVDYRVCLMGFEDLRRFFKDPYVFKNTNLGIPSIVVKDWWDYKVKPNVSDFSTYLSSSKDSYVMEPLLDQRYDKIKIFEKEIIIETYIFEEHRYIENQEQCHNIWMKLQNNLFGCFFDINKKKYIDEIILRRIVANKKWFKINSI